MHMCAGPRPPLPPCVLGCARLKPPLPPMLRTYYVHSPFIHRILAIATSRWVWRPTLVAIYYIVMSLLLLKKLSLAQNPVSYKKTRVYP